MSPPSPRVKFGHGALKPHALRPDWTPADLALLLGRPQAGRSARRLLTPRRRLEIVETARPVGENAIEPGADVGQRPRIEVIEPFAAPALGSDKAVFT